jgi:hypothetical protein
MLPQLRAVLTVCGEVALLQDCLRHVSLYSFLKPT